ncbi:TIR domain-containing protein [Aggregatimonas sangjinii]|uniref:TIR domain-containing protein n=1 Tax=Aggregatimonas sangjinii TaxID=2583587 RepID=A0A5B7SPQ5_9FLAO|nr:toll/interleukin-1 receptor domain-containing protein [Aggregatimonas sangjinii]QCW98999.1 TIR domain-containing protein [Aggregatimonas sangjinii]
MKNPKAFISYAWESDEIKLWVKHLATELRTDGIDAKLDQWEIVPGDQMPHFMEKSVRENDYVLIVCTPKYKSKSENRVGGVGYEGDIMTAEVLQSSNHRKFIPILKEGTKDNAIPSWLQGKYYVNLTNEKHYVNNYSDLTTTLLNTRETAPALSPTTRREVVKNTYIPKDKKINSKDEPIRIKGILISEITQPKNDGTKGSALYKIPFELNRTPSYEWADLFVNAWNRPSKFTSMHRSGIASTYGNKVILDGTTIEEVEKYHKDTLKLAVHTANQQLKRINLQKEQEAERERLERERHTKNIEDIGGRISFD